MPLTPRFLATVDVDGWRLKSYGVTAAGTRPRAALMVAARRQVANALPRRPDQVGAFGVGFFVVHDGGGQCLTLVDWWVRPDELHQRAFAAPDGRPWALAPLTTAAIGGVCDLTITAHEGRAWQRHVVDNPAGCDIDGYLADVWSSPADRADVTG